MPLGENQGAQEPLGESKELKQSCPEPTAKEPGGWEMLGRSKAKVKEPLGRKAKETLEGEQREGASGGESKGDSGGGAKSSSRVSAGYS